MRHPARTEVARPARNRLDAIVLASSGTSVTTPSSARTFDVRHLQLARALFAAVAAVMVTFSTDHSAPVGLSIFSGFALVTGVVFAVAVWLVFPRGQRVQPAVLAALGIVAGLVTSIGTWRSDGLFFGTVIVWALVSGAVEVVGAVRTRRDPSRADGVRDGLVIGILTLVLGVGLLFTPVQYALDYYIADAGRTFTLTGITIGVGLFGAYAAIVAVYLGIAGLSPRRPEPVPAAPAEETAS